MRPPMSLAMAGLAAPAGAPAEALRLAIQRAKALGCLALQLDGRAAGFRARELDRSARRDIAATLRRAGLACSGVDLWIPPEHFAAGGTRDRALSAALSALDLAGEMDSLAVDGPAPGGLAVFLPRPLDGEIRAALIARADKAGVRIADYGWKRGEVVEPQAPLGPGLDPAAAVLAGDDPVGLAGSFGAGIAGVRWSDASMTGRIAPGAAGGRVDLDALGAVLITVGFRGYGVVDLAEAQR